jgi:hypothetical protein
MALRNGAWFLGLGLGAFAACESGDGPSAPTAATPSHETLAVSSGSSALSDLVLTGLVRDSVTGRPVAGARVTLPDLAEAESDGSGSFAIPVGLAGVVSIRAEAEGYFPRQTHARAGTPSTLEIEILPSTGDFDLHFFDHVFRDVGESGTTLWVTEPTFEILTQVFDCVDHETTDACDLFEATDEPVPGQFISLAREVVAVDTSQYTGGAIQGTDVRLVDAAPGTRIQRSEAWVRDKVRFVVARMPDGSSWATRWIYRGTSNYYSAFIVINKLTHKADRETYSHELAHALGYSHPLGGDHVPRPSIMRYENGSGPTRVDVLHGAILYRRPPGSRTPDEDPADYVLNGLRRSGAGAGDLVQETMR